MTCEVKNIFNRWTKLYNSVKSVLKGEYTLCQLVVKKCTLWEKKNYTSGFLLGIMRDKILWHRVREHKKCPT